MEQEGKRHPAAWRSRWIACARHPTRIANELRGEKMSHHYSGPDLNFPNADARLDITDLYAFPKPGVPGTSVLIMNVHPGSTLISHEPTTPIPFASKAVYEIKIDTNGDSIADISYRVLFSSPEQGLQTATLKRSEGKDAAGTGDGGEVVIADAPVSTGLDALVSDAGEYRFFAGWRSDPFFFDTMGALDNLQFTGTDLFINADVCSIILEVPNSALGPGTVGLWHRSLDGTSGNWVQADRGALPSQSIFLSGDHKAEYLVADPVNDARFIPVFAHSLEHTGGYSSEEATRVAKTLLPDILRYNPTTLASYPTNGRALTDDVMDHFISVITNGKIAGDGVGPHTDLLTEFPFLGPPHKSRSAELCGSITESGRTNQLG
jgi:hypothetical protein